MPIRRPCVRPGISDARFRDRRRGETSAAALPIQDGGGGSASATRSQEGEACACQADCTSAEKGNRQRNARAEKSAPSPRVRLWLDNKAARTHIEGEVIKVTFPFSYPKHWTPTAGQAVPRLASAQASAADVRRSDAELRRTTRAELESPCPAGGSEGATAFGALPNLPIEQSASATLLTLHRLANAGRSLRGSLAIPLLDRPWSAASHDQSRTRRPAVAPHRHRRRGPNCSRAARHEPSREPRVLDARQRVDGCELPEVRLGAGRSRGLGCIVVLLVLALLEGCYAMAGGTV